MKEKSVGGQKTAIKRHDERFPKSVLNKIKWTKDPSLRGVELIITSRGEPNDEKSIGGESICKLGRSFFELSGDVRNTMIPYHRIKQILHKGNVVWQSNEKERDEQ